MRLSGHIKKRRLFKTFSCKKLRQFDYIVYLGPVYMEVGDPR